MSFEPPCPQCLFVSNALGQPTPCLLHVALVPIERAETELESDPGATSQTPPDQDYDEPYAFGQLRLSVDRPGPFSLREYVRLQLLRTRIQANPSRLDRLAPRTQAGSLSRR